MESESVCEYLPWDSEFFHRRIAKVTVPRLTEGAVEELIAWCEQQSIDCLYLLAPADETETTRLAEKMGCRLVDIRVTLEKDLRLDDERDLRRQEDVRVAPSTPGDIPALQEIAKTSHRDSRFFHDGNFAEERCAELYSTWIDLSCRGYADSVLVASVSGRPGGYVSLRLSQATGRIELFAVASRFQGMGVGRMLLGHATEALRQLGAERITVATQGRNVRAQRSYQAAGFVTSSIELWYHKWFASDE